MRRVLTTSQAYELDRRASADFNISGESLMGNAGSAIANFISKHPFDNNVKSIAVVVGKGNNGGDGFSAALELDKLNFDVSIFSIYRHEKLSKDSLLFFKKCKENQIPISEGSRPPFGENFDLIVDAILGIGFSGHLRSELSEWVEWINLNPTILCCDAPTGLNSYNGLISNPTVKATHTLTMGFPKVGHCIEPGKSYSGKTMAIDIGFPNIENQLSGVVWRLIDSNCVDKVIKPLNKASNKYTQGKVLVLAGSRGMTGAAYLSSMSALRSGAGLVKVFAPKSLSDIYERKITEGITVSCEDDGEGNFKEKNFDIIMDHVEWADAVLIGPGLGSSRETIDLLSMLYKKIDKPLVIDADGLRPFYKNRDVLKQLQCVLTPHHGELSRLLSISSGELQRDLVKHIEGFVSEYPSVLLAKQPSSIIAHNIFGFINSSGNPGLATAGTGDVLSGMVTAFIAQGYNLVESSYISTYIHGHVADKMSKRISERGLIASDLLMGIASNLSKYES